MDALDVDSRGHIHVLLGQDQQVRVFRPDGSLMHTIGRLGAGPGEFRTPVQLGIDHDDHVWVYDANLSRFSVFDATGTHLADHDVGRPTLPCTDRRLHFTPEGHLIRQHAAGIVLGGGGNGVIPCRFIRYDTFLSPVDSFIPLLPTPHGSPTGGAWLAYQPRVVNVVDPTGSLWRGTSDRYALVRLSFSGDTLARIVGRAPTQTITLEDLVRARQDHDAAWRRAGRAVTASDNANTPAATAATEKPPVAHATVDDLGRLWVALSGPDDGVAWAFDVFARDGSPLGRVAVAAPLSIPSASGADQVARHVIIRGGFVYGIRELEDGSEAVVRLRMTNSSRR